MSHPIEDDYLDHEYMNAPHDHLDSVVIDEPKPFSQACMNNRQPILAVLQRVFAQSERVLEVGSGTGQHAVYFAQELPHLVWQASDILDNVPGILQWFSEQPRPNLPEPLVYDALDPLPEAEHPFDAIFSANTAHIMPWATLQVMLQHVAEGLPSGGIFALYGPFKYGGNYTSESNARFDAWLKANNPERGIRDFERVNTQLVQAGLELMEDNVMPANNRLLVWRKALA